MKKAAIFALLMLATAGLGMAQSTTASTNPVGFVSITVPGHSDASLAVPLDRPAVFQGVIQSISGNTLTVLGAPGFIAGQFVQNPGVQNETYAVLLDTGTNEGMIAKITANTTNTFTVQLDSGDSLTAVHTEAANGTGQGDAISILPYWTPVALFPSGLPDGTEFLGYQGTTAGVNLSASQLYAKDGTAWDDEILGTDASFAPLPFGEAFTLRNNAAPVLSISMVGSVPMAEFRYRLATLAAHTDQDIHFGYLSPVPALLSSLNIPAVTGDEIFVIDNTAVGFNKSASQILVYDTGTWYDAISGNPIAANYSLTPASGYIFRKFNTATPQSVIWQNLQSYLQ